MKKLWIIGLVGFLCMTYIGCNQGNNKEPVLVQLSGGMNTSDTMNDSAVSEEMVPVSSCLMDVLQVTEGETQSIPVPGYFGISRVNNQTSFIQVSFELINPPGTYSLEGITPRTCTTCIKIGTGCSQRGCQSIYFATEGEVVIEALSEPGQPINVTLKDLGFSTLNTQTDEIGEQVEGMCLGELKIDSFLPALIDDELPDFTLQNCGTDEFVDIRTLGQDTGSLWLTGTGGWCPACRDRLQTKLDLKQ